MSALQQPDAKASLISCEAVTAPRPPPFCVAAGCSLKLGTPTPGPFPCAPGRRAHPRQRRSWQRALAEVSSSASRWRWTGCRLRPPRPRCKDGAANRARCPQSSTNSRWGRCCGVPTAAPARFSGGKLQFDGGVPNSIGLMLDSAETSSGSVVVDSIWGGELRRPEAEAAAATKWSTDVSAGLSSVGRSRPPSPVVPLPSRRSRRRLVSAPGAATRRRGGAHGGDAEGEEPWRRGRTMSDRAPPLL
jgi:hypothetical protein